MVEQDADNPRGWPDSACFRYNYTALSGEPDLAGCRAFRKTFEPLANLRACIVPKLRADSKWRSHRSTQWSKWCRNGFPDCEDYDTLRRAEEIIKSVAFKSLPLEPSNVSTLIVRKAKTSSVL